MVAMIKLQHSIDGKEDNYKSLQEALYDKDEGVFKTLDNQKEEIKLLVSELEENNSRIKELEEITFKIDDDVKFLQAIIQCKGKEITKLQDEVSSLKAHKMANNIIHGLDGDDKEEQTKEVVVVSCE